MNTPKGATTKDVEAAKLELGSEIHDLRQEMKSGFESTKESIEELTALLRPTVRALDATLLDIRALKRRVSKLEKHAGISR